MTTLDLHSPDTPDASHRPDAAAPAGRASAFLNRYGDVFWWLHSLWGLLVGVGVMWLGSRHYGLLRIAVFQIAFIWIAALIVPALVDRSKWANRARLVLNYFSRNFYQQILYFLLPIYFASASSWSWNLLFVAVLAVSALISTLDVVYDRHLSVRRSLMAVFFAFNLFACLNVMLPVVWRISNVSAMRASALLAVVAFVTILFGRRVRSASAWVTVSVSAVVLFATIEYARPLIPPAPLRVAAHAFGLEMNRSTLRMTKPAERIDPNWSGRLYVMTPVVAPNGLEDRIGHRWYVNNQLVWASPFYTVKGGRREGYRLFTTRAMTGLPEGWLRVDVVTEAGQLVGRCSIPIAPPAQPEGGTQPVPF